jgi:hypothetical protein
VDFKDTNLDSDHGAPEESESESEARPNNAQKNQRRLTCNTSFNLGTTGPAENLRDKAAMDEDSGA